MTGTKSDTEALLKFGCQHLTGLVALTAGPCVCLTHVREVLEQAAVDTLKMHASREKAWQACEAEAALKVARLSERDAAQELANRMAAERDRLAGDALAALSGAGISTPVEGYVAAPHLLKADILALAARKSACSGHTRIDEFNEMKADLASALKLSSDRLKGWNEALDTVAKLESALDAASARCRDHDMARESAEKALLDQREVLLNLKSERDSFAGICDKYAADVGRYREDAMKAEKNLEVMMQRFILAIELLKALGGAP